MGPRAERAGVGGPLAVDSRGVIQDLSGQARDLRLMGDRVRLCFFWNSSEAHRTIKMKGILGTRQLQCIWLRVQTFIIVGLLIPTIIFFYEIQKVRSFFFQKR